MSLQLESILDYFATYPYVGLGLIFLAAFLEAAAVIGTFIPGSSIVFIGGVLVGTGLLNIWPVFCLATIGAILGDGLSYWIGYRYRTQIPTLWLFRKKPEVLEKGMDFFREHGGKSIILARFIAPIRAIVPVVAGMLSMPPKQFYTLNVLSALGWVLIHILPGILFGTSIQVAGAISSRLVVILILLLVLVWGITKLVGTAFRKGTPLLRHYHDRMIMWAEGHPSFVARIITSLFDPKQPEFKALFFSAILLLISMWVFFGVLNDIITTDPLTQADTSFYELLQNIHISWVDSVMVAITELGGRIVVFAVIVTAFIWFVCHRLWHTAAYWLAAISFAEISIYVLKFILDHKHPTLLYPGVEELAFPSSHATLNIVVYGFLTFLLSRNRPVFLKMTMVSSVAIFITLIAFSRLYLGSHWLSDVMGGLSLGLCWVALMSIAYTYHSPQEDIKPLKLSLLVIITLTVAGYWNALIYYKIDIARYSYKQEYKVIAKAEWDKRLWRLLPAARYDLRGKMEEPFTVQWAATADSIRVRMQAAGWAADPSWSAQGVFLWLLPHPDIQQLPVLPKLNRSHEPQLTFVKVTAEDTRYVLRLWQSEYLLSTNNYPLWYGMATKERILHPLGFVTMAKTVQNWMMPLLVLKDDLHNPTSRTHERDDRTILTIE